MRKSMMILTLALVALAGAAIVFAAGNNGRGMMNNQSMGRMDSSYAWRGHADCPYNETYADRHDGRCCNGHWYDRMMPWRGNDCRGHNHGDYRHYRDPMRSGRPDGMRGDGMRGELRNDVRGMHMYDRGWRHCR